MYKSGQSKSKINRKMRPKTEKTVNGEQCGKVKSKRLMEFRKMGFGIESEK